MAVTIFYLKLMDIASLFKTHGKYYSQEILEVII